MDPAHACFRPTTTCLRLERQLSKLSRAISSSPNVENREQPDVLAEKWIAKRAARAISSGKRVRSVIQAASLEAMN